ncbi:recombinase family protein [Glutamicibacter sp. FR1]|uniref:recombinase family protein n=1 Tax=Glutamicibacter sp. FR1 TaxID=3393744 RepID=UPI0039AF391A
MTTIANDPAASLIDPPKTMAAAVSYLRVSNREQAEKGGTDEGFSIPAQREATKRKAEQLGAGIVEEFVDAGASAKSSDRPELMRMIQYVKAKKVAYCIVHKVDRLALNRADDVSIHLALQQCGSCSYPRPRTSTRPPPGCCCTAACPRRNAPRSRWPCPPSTGS